MESRRVLAAWIMDNGKIGEHLVDCVGGVHLSCLAEVINVG